MPKNNTCPIAHEEMLVPVIADDCLTYEFTAIAKWLLENNGSNPLRRSDTVSVLILNNAARDDGTLLSLEDKMQIVQYLKKLTEHLPNLKVVGIDKIEGISALMEHASSMKISNPTMHNNKIKQKLLVAVESQKVDTIRGILSELVGPAPGAYCSEALNRSIILDNEEIVHLFLAMPGIALENSIAEAIRHNRAQILRALFTSRNQYFYNNNFLQLADSSNAFNAMEVILNNFKFSNIINPNQLCSEDINCYPLPIFYKAVKRGLLSLTYAFLAYDRLDLYLDGDYQRTPLYLAKTCGDHRVLDLLLDHYINYIMKNPSWMTNEFDRNSSSFDNLYKHRDELWDRLRTAIKSKMSNKSYVDFLNQISKPEKSSYSIHPLYKIFSYSTWGVSMFTERNIIGEIQAEISKINDSFNLALG